jgi:antitoxin VapB
MNMHGAKPRKRSARLFRNGRSQAVRLPKEFEFEGKEVLISKTEDGKLVIEEKPKLTSILDWLNENGPIEDFPTDPGDDGLLPLDEVKF